MGDLTAWNLHPVVGAEVAGIDPSRPLDADEVRALRGLFDERGLLLFRNLDIDLAYQNYLSQILIGTDPDTVDRSVVPEGVREMYVSNREERAGAPFGRLLFHSDAMWLPQPFRLLSLYGVTVEEPVEPTLFVSTTHAWDSLPEALRSRLKDLHAIHTQDVSDHRNRSRGDTDVLVSRFEQVETVELPVGHRHPRTGRTMLYVCQQMTDRIAELGEEESEDLLEELFQHLYAPENIFEHHWRPGDLVAWDNQALQHARPNIRLEGPPRTLRKVFAPPALIQEGTKLQQGRRGD